MRILFELSKEHRSLPTTEALCCLHAEHIAYTVLETNENILLVDTDMTQQKIQRLSERLAYTFMIDEHLCSSSPSLTEIQQTLQHHPLQREGTVAIRGKNRSLTRDSQPILDSVADEMTRNKTVRLRHPDIEIRVFITDPRIYITTKIYEIPRLSFEQRKVQHRPFFSPISMHPKLARALINLSQVGVNETLLDPFCGTGGILLEAGLVGARCIGSDIECKMVNGCRQTLTHYNIKNFEIFNADIGDLSHSVKQVDAIVTDFPYGRSTTTKGEQLNVLYKRAFESMSNVLKKGRRAVVGLSHQDFISLGEEYFTVVEVHPVRVHRSLTRYFVVCQR